LGLKKKNTFQTCTTVSYKKVIISKKKHLVRNETLKQETAANDEGRTELTTWAA